MWSKLTAPQTEPGTGLGSRSPDPSTQASGTGGLHGQDWHQTPARDSPQGQVQASAWLCLTASRKAQSPSC